MPVGPLELLLLGFVGAFGIGALVLFLRYNSRNRMDAGEDRNLLSGYETFNEEVIELFDQLEALKKRHEMLPFNDLDYSAHMNGATLELYEKLETDIETLREQWMTIMDIRSEIKLQVEGVTRLSEEAEAKVAKSLEASARLPGIRQQHDQCIAGIAKLEGAHEALAANRMNLVTSRDAARGHFEQLKGFGHETSFIEEEQMACDRLIEQAEQTMVSDPIGMRDVLPELEERMAHFAAWLKDLVQIRQEADDVQERLKKTRSLITGHRESGLHLEGHAVDPEPRLRDAENELSEVMRCIDRGNQEQGFQLLTQAKASVDRANRMIEAQLKARAFCETAIPDRKDDHRLLLQQIEKTQRILEQLQHDNDPKTWEHIEHHVQQARHLIDGHQHSLNNLQLEPGTRRDYVKTADQLAHIGNQQSHARALLHTVAERETELTQIKSDCGSAQLALNGRIEALGNYLNSHHQKLHPDHTRSLETIRSTRNTLSKNISEPKPDWPTLREQLRLLLAEVDSLHREAEADVADHERLLGTIQAVREDNRVLGEFLEQHKDDRERPNRTYRELQDEIDDLNQRANRPQADWAALMDKVDSIQRDLVTIREHAQSDIDLAGQARTSIREAERAIAHAETFNSHGVSVWTNKSRSMVKDAENELRTRDYEDALKEVRRAREALHENIEEAHDLVRKRKAKARKKRMDTIETAASIGASILGEVIRANIRGRRGGGRHWRF